ncbi:efflux RND transporter periplasmic adaptor subunit [Desulfosporosinus lacus]|uniref:RND family efflux transporter, MFP subunit n=1 Tax=Desulfosporosinus lacus DSM 15449 TaxID=1121420 RepID=A0A1M5ZB94_9FIRM|nr:efflux RND transporter periplasmic adaptor subunit [Desulfosporosinus lacus]SHI21494.1 RND family efflux transporter, MFP subunit [Desulfosporosinus lacus DSM 15449]
MLEKIGLAIRGFKITKKKVLTIVIVFVLAGTGVRSFRGKPENTIAETAPNIVCVKATVAENVIEQAIISYKASLEASEEGIVSGKVSGKVVQVLFENGQYVTQGDPLIKLDDQEIRNNIASSQAQLKASESQVKSAESQLVASQTGLQKVQMNVDNAVRTYARMKALFDGGAISKVELENSETALTNAKSDLESAEANIELSRSNIETSKANLATAQVDLKILTDSLEDTKITAPITGIMDEKSVDLGQYANMGVVLVKVKAISPIYAVIEVDQNDISSLQVGQSAKVTVGSNVVKDYDGIIKSIEASADAASRVFKCKVEVANPDQALKPGIYAKVDIVSDQTSEVIAVTTDALSGNPGNYTVFVIDQGVARKRIVSIGKISKGLVEIKDGVKNGDSVIITNVNTLQDGDAVSVVKE